MLVFTFFQASSSFLRFGPQLSTPHPPLLVPPSPNFPFSTTFPGQKPPKLPPSSDLVVQLTLAASGPASSWPTTAKPLKRVVYTLSSLIQPALPLVPLTLAVAPALC